LHAILPASGANDGVNLYPPVLGVRWAV
jgi:hypothetical protein